MKFTLTILSAFFLCAFCTKAVTYSDTWAGTASNQGLTNAAMYDATTNFQTYLNWSLSTYPNTGSNRLKLLTKNAFNSGATYNNFNSSYPAFSSKSGSQIVVKSDITISFEVYTTTTASPDCNVTGSTITLYCNPNLTGKMYTDTGLTTPYAGNGQYYLGASSGASGVSLRIASNGDISDINFPC
jgi:hypothetical protein